MRKAALLSTVLIALSATAHAEIIEDGFFFPSPSWEFSSWSTLEGLPNAPGTAMVTREATGGHPGARLNITTQSGTTVYGTAIKSDVFVDDALEGKPFTLSLDVLSGPGARGEGQGILLLVEQNTTVYGKILDFTSFPHNWDALNFNGTFNASAFTRAFGSGPNQPNFTGGVPTFFGFAAGNTQSGSLTQYYDNFRLDSDALQILQSPPCMVPEPGSFVNGRPCISRLGCS